MTDTTAPVLDHKPSPADAAGGVLSAAERIRELARRHGVAYERTALDDYADDVARLSDSEVELDEVGQLIVALGRAGVVSGPEGVALHAAYLRERNA